MGDFGSVFKMLLALAICGIIFGIWKIIDIIIWIIQNVSITTIG
jgi:VIT1/CCC1 family predicted Fe2+/Mn2+ transporter